MSKIVVLMGVSGCGKSTTGERLAERTGGSYFDGDDFHPPENVEKMREGKPLTDEDRVGWMSALKGLIVDQLQRDEWTFIACSALRRQFRDGLRETDPNVQFVLLEGSFELISKRMSAREGHYMPTSLLQSQFAALEDPESDETGISRVSIEPGPAEVASEVAVKLGV